MNKHAKQQKMLNKIAHKRIDPPALSAETTVTQLVDEAFLSYNAGRLREASRLFTAKMLQPDVTVGLTLAGALSPAGLCMSALVPLVEAGFIDWIVSTGANLYHDTHYALGMDLHQSRPDLDDCFAAQVSESIRDALDGLRVAQKVLAEPGLGGHYSSDGKRGREEVRVRFSAPLVRMFGAR